MRARDQRWNWLGQILEWKGTALPDKSYYNASNQPQNLSLVTYRGWKYKQR